MVLFQNLKYKAQKDKHPHGIACVGLYIKLLIIAHPVSYIQRSCTDFTMNKKKRGEIVSKRECISFLVCCIIQLHLLYLHSRSPCFPKRLNRKINHKRGKSQPFHTPNFFHLETESKALLSKSSKQE